jgi:hypothetical protein
MTEIATTTPERVMQARFGRPMGSMARGQDLVRAGGGNTLRGYFVDPAPGQPTSMTVRFSCPENYTLDCGDGSEPHEGDRAAMVFEHTYAEPADGTPHPWVFKAVLRDRHARCGAGRGLSCRTSISTPPTFTRCRRACRQRPLRPIQKAVYWRTRLRPQGRAPAARRRRGRVRRARASGARPGSAAAAGRPSGPIFALRKLKIGGVAPKALNLHYRDAISRRGILGVKGAVSCRPLSRSGGLDHPEMCYNGRKLRGHLP